MVHYQAIKTASHLHKSEIYLGADLGAYVLSKHDSPFLNMFPFGDTVVAGMETVEPNNHASWVAVATTTDRR